MNLAINNVLLASLVLTPLLATRVHADNAEVDLKSFEYVDVVETTDGSIWKGVIVEQEPGVQYKIATADGSLHVLKAGDVTKLSKQRNRDYHAGSVALVDRGTGERGNGVDAHFEPHAGGGLPAPFAVTGVRMTPDVAMIFPTGDAGVLNTSFAPTFHGGYELMLGNLGLEGGGMIRYTYWRIPGDTQNAAWTLETHAYARAALHISRVALHAGVSVGVDTNLLHNAALGMSTTATGFGMNIESGVEIAATPVLALGLGFGYHPATDTIADGAPQSMEYFALTAGATMRL
jgi:hypothetical protein